MNACLSSKNYLGVVHPVVHLYVNHNSNILSLLLLLCIGTHQDKQQKDKISQAVLIIASL